MLEIEKEPLDCPLWRTRLGSGYGPGVRQTTVLINHINCRIFARFEVLTTGSPRMWSRVIGWLQTFKKTVSPSYSREM